MQKIKIIIVVPAFNLGGAERMATYLALYLNKDRFDVSIISNSPKVNNELTKMLEQHNIQVFYLNKKKGLDITLYPRLYKLIEDLNPKIIHSHQSVQRYLFPFYTKKRLFIHTIHNVASRELENYFARKLQKILYMNGLIPVSISDNVTKTILEEYHLIHCDTIPNGIPLENYSLKEKDRSLTRYELGLSSEDFIFVNVAGFRKAKNHKLLITAFKDFLDTGGNGKLLLVGDGFFLDESKKLACTDNIQDKVYFLGLRSDIPQILNASDVFVLSSDWEGYPLSVLEAMASGLPVISTDVGGVPEIISNKISGLLVKPNNPESLSKAMVSLYEDSNLRDFMGQKGREIAYDKFSVRTMCLKYEELYLHYLKKRKLL